MPWKQPSPSPSSLLQLPREVWQEVVVKLPVDDQQNLTHTCKQVHQANAASATTQLSMSQATMTPFPNRATAPASFTAVWHLTLNLAGNLSNHTHPFLQSLQQHCSAPLSALTSLTLKLNFTSDQALEQVGQLLGSCHSLSKLKLELPAVHDINITLSEQPPGAGLHHLSPCFLQGSSSAALILQLLSTDTLRQHIIGVNLNLRQWDPDTVDAIGDLPALQELRIMGGTPIGAPTLASLTSLTRLHLYRPSVEEEQLNDLFQQSIPSLVLLRDLNLENYRGFLQTPPTVTLPPSWSSLQQLTKLNLEGCKLTEDSGVWQLTGLESLCLTDCSVLARSSGFSSLVGLQRLQLLKIHDVAYPAAVATFPSGLTTLELRMCGGVFGLGWSPWVQLARISNAAGTMRSLSVSCKTLWGLGFITQLTSLQQLDVRCANYSDSTAISLQPLVSMTQLTSLSLELFLAVQWHSGLPLELLPEPIDLQSMTRLQELNLDGHLSLAIVAGVPSSLTCLTSPGTPVRTAVMRLPESLRHCKSLSRLTLWAKNSDVSDPASTLGCLTSLQSLELAMAHPDILAAMNPMSFLTTLHLDMSNTHQAHRSCQGITIVPAWLQYCTRLKSLTLRGFNGFPPALPATLTYLEMLVHHDEPYALPLQWGCRELRSLKVTAINGMSGVPGLAALTSLSALHLAGVMDPNINALDTLSMLTNLTVYAHTGHRVTYWLPQLRALKAKGWMRWYLADCIEVPPPPAT